MARPIAIPFITREEDGSFNVSSEAIAAISGIPPPLAVVSVAGMYRTGKVRFVVRMHLLYYFLKKRLTLPPASSPLNIYNFLSFFCSVCPVFPAEFTSGSQRSTRKLCCWKYNQCSNSGSLDLGQPCHFEGNHTQSLD